MILCYTELHVIFRVGVNVMEQIDMFDIINTKNEIPDKKIPKTAVLKKKELWCPYCSKPVIFTADRVLGVKRCPYCGISNKDYNVKMVNDRWIKR